MDKKMTKTLQIYIDRSQCSRFEIPYFQSGNLSVSARKLLESKDYDNWHTETLSFYGFDTISLSRKDVDPPGWYTILSEANVVDV